MFSLSQHRIEQDLAQSPACSERVVSLRGVAEHGACEGRDPQYQAALIVQNRYPSPLAGFDLFPGRTPHFSFPARHLARRATRGCATDFLKTKDGPCSTKS